jgi:pimeloyl-ACP methyl ester carboxylesterase
MADDVAGLIKELELREPLVIGYSDGGQIALELALSHPGLAAAGLPRPWCIRWGL